MIEKSTTRHRSENLTSRSGAEGRSDEAPERGADSTVAADPEVLAKPKRHQFSAAYRLRILEEADDCHSPGEIGRLLRREGLYSSHLATWRKARRDGALSGLAPKKRGAKPAKRNPLQPKVQALETEVARLQGELRKAQTILEVQGKVAGLLGINLENGNKLVSAAQELAQQVGVVPACRALGVSRATYYRYTRPQHGPQQPRKTPARALAPSEREGVRDVLYEERFVDRSPAEVVATLLDEGRYLCSERTMYRLLAEDTARPERRSQLRHPAYTKPELVAKTPNQVWSWDITKLLGPLDLFSRYVVGWMVADRENATLAGNLIEESCHKQDVAPEILTLHSDRGSPMTAKCTAQLLADLGVTQSLSRPRVSDDNPFSESQFKTLKYHPGFPGRFDGQSHATDYCRDFFPWYNHDHRHSGIAMLTPADVHFGHAQTVLTERQRVLESAYANHPERFPLGKPRPAALPEAVYINPPPAETADGQQAEENTH